MEGPVPITIEVKDINDNRPTFLQKKYEGSVRQNSRPGKRREARDTYGKTIRQKGRICGAHSCRSFIKHFLSYLNFTAALWELFYCPHCSVTCSLSFGTTNILGPIILSLSGCPLHCRVLAASLTSVYSPGTSSNPSPQAVTKKMPSDIAKCHLGDEITPAENYDFRTSFRTP